MEAAELFVSCRIGDLDRVRDLVECSNVELNLRDGWDSTPLYYACLCGHEQLVEFLLINGARCEPKAFDGERCLYAALTDRIRKVLKKYRAITPECMRRESYREFLRRCSEDSTFADVCFLVHGQSFHLHRCILSVRSSYFADMLASKWKDKTLIELNHPLVKPWAFKAIVQFLYTDRLDIGVEEIDDCIRLSRQCRLTALKLQLESTKANVQMFGMSKPGTQKITLVSIEPESGLTDMNDAFGQLAELAIPPALRLRLFAGPFFVDAPSDVYAPKDTDITQFRKIAEFFEKSRVVVSHFFRPFVTSLPDDQAEEAWDERDPYADVCFLVEGYRFYGHQVFFCGRSDYFQALLSGRFQEGLSPGTEVTGRGSEAILEVRLRDISADVFAVVVAFIYQDHARISDEILAEVMWTADLHLLPGLKRLCAGQINKALDPDSVVQVLRMSRMLNSTRLEEDCCAFIAKNLDALFDNQEFHTLIQEDAADVCDRQEVDSIPLVDDIRSYLYSGLLPTGAGEDDMDCEKKLDLMNELLVRLGVEC